MKIERHTVQYRLRDWGHWTQQAREELAFSYSPFGRIVEMQENAGARAEGLVYEVIDGTPCPPDGGMSRALEYKGKIIVHNIRCRETRDAVAWLPEQMRRVIVDTYVVPAGNEPRSSRRVAERLEIAPSTVLEALRAAHDRIARRIYGPFEIADDMQEEQAA